MHPQHFFDQEQNKRWPEINFKIFVLNKGIACFSQKSGLTDSIGSGLKRFYFWLYC